MTPPPLSPAPAEDVPGTAPATPAIESMPRWRSDQLLAGAPEALIEHGGSTYRLRLTLLGKLILTK